MGKLNLSQQRFFDTFGYLVFPGLLEPEIKQIISEFEAVFEKARIKPDPAKRAIIVPFIDQSAYLSGLLDHPAIEMIAEGLLGEDFNYIGSDGNFYTGDTAWHSDGYHVNGGYLKIALYLDPVGPDSGALRVIPGSHRLLQSDDIRKAARAKELWGIEQAGVPAAALASQPGDVVVFNHNIMHASFGGGSKRRMFTLNLCRHCQTGAEIEDLEQFIAGSARFWLNRMHGQAMLETASAGRLRHLQQVIEHETHLPALSAKARLEMVEPARS
jgi:ectoine hydroxylase-related dioxygenase (phytanoyl-CoA dioxygenase family)